METYFCFAENDDASRLQTVFDADGIHFDAESIRKFLAKDKASEQLLPSGF